VSALVTGASRGIGRAVALELAARGHRVVATMRDAAAGHDLASASIRVQRMDVTDPDAFRLPDDLTVLVNNAAVDGENHAVEDTPVDEWRRQFETNVFGLVEVTRRALPILRANGGGVIVNLSSASVAVPMPFFAVYRATKAAVQAMNESLRPEVAPFGIHVVEVWPGPVDTDMLAGSKREPEGARSPAYAPLAAHVATLRAHESSTPVAEAARRIVDALEADPPPHRVACDDVGDSLLEGWSNTPDPDWQAGFLQAFRPTGSPR
jgi:NAD(P)-dependent dehydrogenase (short-subunit alcohol dehydrogenase family)